MDKKMEEQMKHFDAVWQRVCGAKGRQQTPKGQTPKGRKPPKRRGRYSL